MPDRRRLGREIAVLALLLVCYAIGASRVTVEPDGGAAQRSVAPSAGSPVAGVERIASDPGPVTERPLADRHLLIPVAGVAPTQLTPSFDLARGARRHEALDIMAPRGTPVVAVDDGTVAKLFTSAAGGLTVYQFDLAGRYAYYYAHLERYANGLEEGARLKRGDPIGTVGSSGNARPDAPHLHFAIFLLGPERRWWEGTAIDPFPILTRSEPHLQPEPERARQ